MLLAGGSNMACKKQFSAVQRQLLLEYIEKNPDLVKQRVSNQYTSANMRSKWIEVTNILNAVPGTNKSWKEWRKCWSDIKARTKKKQAQLNKSVTKTGGGPPETEVMSATEDKILELLGGKVLVEGNYVLEAGLSTIENPLKVQTYLEDPSQISDVMDHEDCCVAETEPVEDIIIENEPKNTEPKSTNVKRVRPMPSKFSKQKKSNLSTSIEMAKNFAEVASNQSKFQKKYFNEKLELLRKDVLAKERIASALENIANSINYCTD